MIARPIHGLALLISLFVATTCAESSSAQLRPSSLRVVETHAASGDVRDVCEYEGRVLLATAGGLVARRGTSQRVYTSRDGLMGTRSLSVSVTSDGVWVGGVEGVSLVAFEAERFVVRRTLPLRRVTRAIEWNEATYLATFGGGLHRLSDGARLEAIDLGRSHARRRLTDLMVVGDKLWVATSGAGVIKLRNNHRILSRLRSARGLPSDHVWDLEPGPGGRVLVATSNGLGVVRRGRVEGDHLLTSSAEEIPVRDLRAVHRQGSRVWAGSFGSGVYELTGGRAHPIAGAPRVQSMGGALGELWVGHREGASTLSNGQLSTVIGGGLPSSDISAIAHAFGKMFIGTFAHGLATMSAHGVEVSNASSRFGVDPRINDLASVGQGASERLYIATDRGLYVHDGRSFEPIIDRGAPYRVHVTSLFVDPRNDDLWVTSSRQLSRLRGGQWRSWGGDPRFPVMQLHSVSTDREGEVWVGSLHGLFRLDIEGGTFDRHTVSSGDLPVDWVTALVHRRDGRMVAGTYHGGLSVKSGERFEIERESPRGLPAGWVNPHAIKELSGRLFIGTLERGLVVEAEGGWEHYSVADGLPSADVTDTLELGGSVWVATRGGLVRMVRR